MMIIYIGWIIIVCVLTIILIRCLSSRRYVGGMDSAIVTGDRFGVCNIHASVTTETHVSIEEIRQMVKSNFSSLPFRSRLVRRRWWWNYWEEVDAFNVTDHIIERRDPTIDASSRPPELQHRMERIISQEMSLPLDINRPLWQILIYPSFGPGSLVILKVHHSVADGVSLMRLAKEILQTEEETTKIAPSPPQEDSFATSNSQNTSSPADATSLPPPYPPIPFLALDAVGSIGRVLGQKQDPASLLWKVSSPISHPAEVPVTARWMAMQNSREQSSKPDSSIIPSISLSDLKHVAKLHDVKVNDVLMTCVAGAMAEVQSNTATEGNFCGLPSTVQGLVWATLRGDLSTLSAPLDPNEFIGGNCTAACAIDLPLRPAVCDIKSSQRDLALGRLRSISSQTRRLTSSLDGYIAYVLLSAVGLLPEFIGQRLLFATGYKSSVSLSNLPGPPSTVRIAGARVEQIQFWVPPLHTGSHIITLLSYRGEVSIGMTSDSRLVDPKQQVELLKGCHQQLKVLREATKNQPAIGSASPSTHTSTLPRLSHLDYEYFQYLLSHSSPGNQLIHAIFVPVLLITILMLLMHFFPREWQFTLLGHSLSYHLGMVLWFGYALFFTSMMGLAAAIPVQLFLFGVVYSSIHLLAALSFLSTTELVLVISFFHIIAWFAQLLSHSYLEGVHSPIDLRTIYHSLLLAPLHLVWDVQVSLGAFCPRRLEFIRRYVNITRASALSAT